MLIEFTAENFRSLKARVTLSLIAAPRKTRSNESNSNNLIFVNERLSLLRGVAIYGANASGKSNIIRAFALMRHMVRQSASYQDEDTLPMEPFMLTPHTRTAPSTFEAVFLISGIQYRYGFTADSARIHAEWLFVLASSRESTLFTRDIENRDDTNGIHVNRDKFKEGVGTEKQTGNNQLFLSKVASNQGAMAKEVREFLVKRCATMNTANDGTTSYTMKCLHENLSGYRDKIVEMVRRLDVDILDLRVEEQEIPREVLEQLVASKQIPEDDNERRMVRLFTKHRVRDSDGVPIGEDEFDYSDSVSDGTRKVIALAGPIVDALAKGVTVFADELDSRLHPKLTRALLELFLSPETNPHNAQLIFATHDTNLLDRRLLRRDQIYFCQKERDATRIYSLADFTLPEANGGSARVRKDASFETDYIEGRYGAIPYLGDVRGLFLEEFSLAVADEAKR